MVLAFTAAAFLAMHGYLRRAVQAKWKSNTDSFYDQQYKGGLSTESVSDITLKKISEAEEAEGPHISVVDARGVKKFQEDFAKMIDDNIDSGVYPPVPPSPPVEPILGQEPYTLENYDNNMDELLAAWKTAHDTWEGEYEAWQENHYADWAALVKMIEDDYKAGLEAYQVSKFSYASFENDSLYPEGDLNKRIIKIVPDEWGDANKWEYDY